MLVVPLFRLSCSQFLHGLLICNKRGGPHKDSGPPPPYASEASNYPATPLSLLFTTLHCHPISPDTCHAITLPLIFLTQCRVSTKVRLHSTSLSHHPVRDSHSIVVYAALYICPTPRSRLSPSRVTNLPYLSSLTPSSFHRSKILLIFHNNHTIHDNNFAQPQLECRCCVGVTPTL